MKKASSIVFALILAVGLLPGLIGCGGAPAEEAAPVAPVEKVAPAVVEDWQQEKKLAESWKEAYAKGISELEWFKYECARLRAEIEALNLPPMTFKAVSQKPVGGEQEVCWRTMLKIMEAESGGKIKWEWYPASILYGSLDSGRALAIGACDLWDTYLNVTINPLANCSAELYSKTAEGLMAYCFSDEYKAFLDELFQHPMINIYRVSGSFGPGGTADIESVKPVTKVGDLKGLSVNTYGSPFQRKMAEALGMVGNDVSTAETYMALYQGSLDVYWRGGRISIYDNKYYQVCKYIWNSPTWPGSPETGADSMDWARLGADMYRTRFLELPRPYQDMMMLVFNEGWEWWSLNIQREQEYIFWRLVNELGMINLDIKNKHPEIYQNYFKVYQELMRKEVESKLGAAGLKRLDEQIAVVAKSELPENRLKFIPWHQRFMKEAKEIIAEAQARIKAGEDADKVWKSYGMLKVVDDKRYVDSYDELVKEVVGVESHVAGEKSQLKRPVLE